VTLKQLADQELRKKTTSRTLHVAYEPDHGNLFPELRKLQTRAPRYIKIEPAEAKKLGISGSRKYVSFTPTAMPDVALSGRLKITAYPTVELEPLDEATPTVAPVGTVTPVAGSKNDIKNIDIPDEPTVIEEGKHLKITAAKTDASRVVKIRRSASREPSVTVPNNLPVGDFLPPVTRVPLVDSDENQQLPSQVATFTPKLISQKVTETKPVSGMVLASPLITTLLAGAVVLFILLGSVRVVVSDDDYDVQLVFQMKNLLDLLQR
jgi:hypothetical protein